MFVYTLVSWNQQAAAAAVWASWDFLVWTIPRLRRFFHELYHFFENLFFGGCDLKTLASLSEIRVRLVKNKFYVVVVRGLCAVESKRPERSWCLVTKRVCQIVSHQPLLLSLRCCIVSDLFPCISTWGDDVKAVLTFHIEPEGKGRAECFWGSWKTKLPSSKREIIIFSFAL